MNKFILICLMLASSFVANAETIVKVFWPFPVGDGQSIYLKSVLDHANELQKDYVFILMSTPGGGGVVAVNNATTSAGLTLLAHTSSYFIRPMVYQQGRYEFSNFKPIAIIGESPVAVVKQKNNSKPIIKIGIGGLGTTTHIISLVAQTRNKELEIIPYKGFTDSLLDLRNGSIDATFNFVKIIEQYDDLEIVGTTGTKQIKNYPLLKNVIDDAMIHFNIPLFVMAPLSMDQRQFVKLQSILIKAARSDSRLAEMVRRDSAIFSELPINQYDAWYQNQIINYKKYTKDLKLD